MTTKKTKKNIKVRDLKPRKDAKGGLRSNQTAGQKQNYTGNITYSGK